ncbi:MAG TPA: DUF1566 domain-containing protein [Parafilimonas sp.]|nr:DUF1566 domain-containing protein [Parafilimonas sp.]
MKTTTKLIAVLLLTTALSCTKSINNKPTSVSAGAVDMSTQAHYIGQNFGGGIIVYLDSTKLHGLIAAKVDQGTNVSWYNGSYISTGAKGATIGTGAANTSKIITKQGNGTYAAKLCKKYRGGGFSDWFLPSKAELNQVFLHRNKLTGISATNYWSSTESDANNAYDQEFGGGFKFADDKSFTIHVRAVRSF